MKPSKSRKRARVKLRHGEIVKLATELLKLHCRAVEAVLRAAVAR